MTKSRIVVASLAVALIAGACGSGGSKGAGGSGAQGTSAVALTASKATSAAKTAKVSIQATSSGTAPGTAPSAISGDGVISFNPSAADLAVKVPTGGTLTIRVVGQILYLMVPPQAGQPASQKPWIEINLNQAAQSKLGTSFSSLSPSGSVNPADVLGYLQGVSQLTKVGTEAIQGVQTTHYRGTVSLDKLAGRLSGQAKSAYRQIEAKLHTTTVPIELWVDSRGRAVQVRTQVPEPATTTTTASGASSTSRSSTTAPATIGTVTTTVDYSDFGVPVHVSAPPASQVTNLTQSATSG